MSELLAHDHAKLNESYYDLCVAFEKGEIPQTHDRLDRFWAGLAVHIRAEHLVLFPAILSALRVGNQSGAPSLAQAESMVEQLRHDHDFFMRQLAEAIRLMRGFLDTSASESEGEGIETVQEIIAAVVQRLATHNKIEEEGIYLWVGSTLNELQRSELTARVQHELSRMPPRFEAPR